MPLSPGPIPRLKDHCPVLLGIFLVCRRLPWESADIQDLSVTTSSARPLLHHPVLKVCVYTLKRQIFVLCFVSENSFIQCLVGDIFRPSQSFRVCVCVCVCEAHEQSRATHSCNFFQRTVMPLAPYFRVVYSSVVRKEKRKQFTYLRTVFTLYFVVHLTVTYTGRLNSLVLYLST